MIDGNDEFELEAIHIHESCKKHKQALLIEQNTKTTPEDSPAQILQMTMNNKIVNKIENLFRNVHDLINILVRLRSGLPEYFEVNRLNPLPAC